MRPERVVKAVAFEPETGGLGSEDEDGVADEDEMGWEAASPAT